MHCLQTLISSRLASASNRRIGESLITRIEEIEARLAKTQPGLWAVQFQHYDDGVLIDQADADLAFLLKRVRGLEEELRTAKIEATVLRRAL